MQINHYKFSLDKKDDVAALQLKKELHHAWTYEAIVAANEILGENLTKVQIVPKLYIIFIEI